MPPKRRGRVTLSEGVVSRLWAAISSWLDDNHRSEGVIPGAQTTARM